MSFDFVFDKSDLEQQDKVSTLAGTHNYSKEHNDVYCSGRFSHNWFQEHGEIKLGDFLCILSRNSILKSRL